jgi:glycosyltransferase involved in cell wall biosynthesis
LKKKYIYFFRADLKSHVHFYKNWVDAVRENGFKMDLITFVSPKVFFNSYDLVRKYKSSNFKIFIDLKFSPFTFCYFFIVILLNDITVIHLKKRKINQFVFLKKIFPNKIKIILEGEGDPVLEHDFLSKHPYKNKFYNEVLKDLKNEILSQKNNFDGADYLTFGYSTMKELLIKRFPGLNLQKKIFLANMSFKKGSLFYSKEIRINFRKKYNLENKKVFIYTGNAFYSWQCVFRSIEIFKLIKSHFDIDSFLILLVRPQDHEIVDDFLKKLQIPVQDYLLTHTDHNNINNFLNLSDFGFALRHNHEMNNTTPSAKIIEYLGSGLPIITTNSMGDVTNLIKEKRCGLVLDDMDDNKEIINKFLSFLNYSGQKRKIISLWANQNLSTEAKIKDYINLLTKI